MSIPIKSPICCVWMDQQVCDVSASEFLSPIRESLHDVLLKCLTWSNTGSLFGHFVFAFIASTADITRFVNYHPLWTCFQIKLVRRRTTHISSHWWARRSRIALFGGGVYWAHPKSELRPFSAAKPIDRTTWKLAWTSVLTKSRKYTLLCRILSTQTVETTPLKGDEVAHEGSERYR